VRGLIAFVLLVACTPAPVLNPNKPSAKQAGRSEVERDVTLATAPEAMVKKRDGSPFDLATLWEKEKAQKVVVVFYRGGWCPHCAKQLGELQQHHKDFTEAKAVVVAISNEPGDAATALRDKLGLGYELYSDPELAMITKWGVEDYGQGIARPATFVVEPGGAISYRKVGENPADHPSMDELLAALR
jgi:peroxiredoxin